MKNAEAGVIWNEVWFPLNQPNHESRNVMTMQEVQAVENVRLYQIQQRAAAYYWAATQTVSGIDRANYIRKAVALYDLGNWSLDYSKLRRLFQD